jgi:hypothetical protein
MVIRDSEGNVIGYIEAEEHHHDPMYPGRGKRN